MLKASIDSEEKWEKKERGNKNHSQASFNGKIKTQKWFGERSGLHGRAQPQTQLGKSTVRSLIPGPK